MVSSVTDMWSVGVLAYVLLSGLNPFTAETNQQMIDNISNAAYSYDDESFKQVSVEALDFTDRLMTKDRKHRMSAAEALAHPWLTKPSEEISTRAIQTSRHKRYYQSMVKKEWKTVVSVARVASGGSIRSQRGVFVAKVKIAPFEHGPLGGQIGHAVVNEGDNVKFICNIENYDSSTEVTWYCGVRQLEAGDKYEIEYEDGLAVITINKVTRADDGTYRCKVVNEYGEDSSYAELFINGVRSYRDFFTTRVVKRTKRRVDTARMLQKPPEFTLPLVNHTAYIGEDVRFGVTITVHPEPRVIWHKSGQKINPGDDDKKYKFITDKGLYQLIIHKVDEDDDAEYSVVARNRYGDDSCKARLTIVPRPKPADLTLRPMFKRLLANVECREGQNIRFEIRVSGRPALKWEKDGTPLAFGPSIEVVHEGLDYFILHVRDTLPEDSGVYRVTATNSAGSASCQATLKVERVTHVKKEFEISAKEKEEIARKEEIDKKVRLSQILSDTVCTPLPPLAVQAVREAATMFKPAVTTKKGEKTEAEIQKEKEERKKRADEKRLRMPYDVPAPRVINPAVLEEDVEIKHFQPLSDMKWYKKLRDQYEFPEPMDKIKQKRMKRIRLSRWEQFYEVPIRIKDQYKPRWRISSMTQDDLETVRPARHRTPSPEMDAYHRIRRRSLGDLSDEELLLPVNEYLSMKRTEEERLRLEDELELGYSMSPPSLSPVRFELSALARPSSPRKVYSDDEEGEEIRRYDSYRIPSKYEAGPSYLDLQRRHDKAMYKPPRMKQRVHEEREDQELLRPHKTAQRISTYKSELKRMDFEEKTRTTKKETTVSVFTSSEGVESEHLTPVASEYIRKPIKLSMPEPEMRRSLTPDRALKTDVTLPRVDFASRYEERKHALRSERRSVERTYEVVTQEPFSLDHAPRITIRLRSHRVPYGSSTKFTLNVQAKPDPQVQWYHNGKEIHQSSKYHMTNISGVLTLKISNCVTEDAGTYRVVCKNAKGETSDYATLDVAAEYAAFSSSRKDEEPPSSHLPEMTRTEVYHVSSSSSTSSVSKTTVKESVTEKVTEVKETTTVVEKRKEKPTVSAKIVSKPKSLTVEEGSLARFECEVEGDPAPSISWLHEGEAVGSTARHHIVSTQFNSSFEISAVEMSDEGSYSLLVENAGGKQEAHFTLSIRKSESKEKVVARITSPEAKSPEPVKSPPRVKSPEPIKSPRRVMSPVSPKSPTPKSPTPKSPTPKSPTPSQTERVTSPIKSPKRVMSPVEKKPSFTVGLSDVTATSDSMVKLSVKVSGEPKISWTKAGKVLSQGRKYEIFEESGSAYLEIYELEESDAGVYKCTATNSAGVSVSTMCTVTVQASKVKISEEMMKQELVSSVTEVKSSQMSIAGGQAPHILVQPRSQNVDEGQNVKFTCEMAGDPTPEVEWLKDNVTISVTSNIRLSRSGSVYTLEIREASLADSGKYTIRARNQFGQCSATSSLNVLTLVEEPTKMIIVEQKGAASMQHVSGSSGRMEAVGFSSSSLAASAAQYAFESMSATSMSAMTAESMVSMSSSSQMMEMSAHSHVEASSSSSSSSSLTAGTKRGTPPKIEALPQRVSTELGQALTVAGVFSGDPAPSVQWVRQGRTLPNGNERCHVENTSALSTLVISGVKEDDGGAYTLRLANEFGSDSATVNVHIRSM